MSEDQIGEGPGTEPVVSVTVQDMDQLVADLKIARDAVEAHEELGKPLNKRVAELQAKGAQYLKALGRDKYPAPDGTLYFARTWTVSTPKTDQEKEDFFAWCRERGIENKYKSVNSQSLNSLYKSMSEEAEAKGEFFNIPGIGAPQMFETLRFLKSRG